MPTQTYKHNFPIWLPLDSVTMMQAMFQFESAEISKEHLPEMVKISKEGIYS